MKPQTFELTVPNGNRPTLLAALAKLEHVTVDPKTNKGRAVPPDGAGLEFIFEPVHTSKDKVKVTVTKNPHGVSLDYIMGRLDGDVKYLSTTPKPKAMDESGDGGDGIEQWSAPGNPPPPGSTVGLLD